MIRKLKKGDEIRFKDGGWIRVLEGPVKVKIAIPSDVRIVKSEQKGNNTQTTTR